MSNVVILGGTDEARLILRGLLRLHQHRVYGETASPGVALELLGSTPEPVLLLDVDLQPQAWSDFVLEALRAQSITRIVLLTPSRSARLESQAKSLGVASLVRRPFAIHELMDAVGSPSRPPASGGGEP